MTIPFRQLSFAGGEIAPSLYGRNDSPRYAHSLRRCRNFIITPQGGALNRPGTTYVAGVKDHTKRVRLVPFEYTDSESYVLEFGDLYVRFYKNGSQILSGMSPYEVVTTYTEAELPYLKFAQVGDVLHITHGAHDPATLTRTADADWDLVDMDFTEVLSYSGPRDPGLEELPSADNDADATHVAREWIWKATLIYRNIVTGEVFEGLPVTIDQQIAAGYVYTAAPTFLALYSDRPVTVWWPDQPLHTTPPDYVDLEPAGMRVYRGRKDLFGFVGETSTWVPGWVFIDVGEAPDYTIQPPAGRNPFEFTTGAPGSTTTRIEKPYCVGFYEQRLGYAGTDERPDWTWLSATNDFDNFDSKVSGTRVASDAVEFALASFRREEVRSLLGLDSYFLFTSAGVWTMTDIAADLVPVAKKQTDEGASWVSPLVVGDSILYVRNMGVGINQIGYENERGKFTVSDLAIFSPHLLEGQVITEWAYARDPHRLIYAVRDDGVLLTITYQREHEVLAWAWHDTQGEFESVCTVPEGIENVAYVVVNREVDGNTRRYVERFSSRIVADVDDAVFLDCAKTYTSVDHDAPVTGLDHLEGRTVYGLADGAVIGPFVVDGGEIDVGLPADADVLHIGLTYTPQLETLDLVADKKEIRTTQKIVKSVVFEVVGSRGLYLGESFDRMSPWRQRTVGDSYANPALFTGPAEVSIEAGWNLGGRACLEQRDPLPVAVHAVTRKVDLGG